MHKFFRKNKQMFSEYLSQFLNAYDQINIYGSVDGIYEYIYKKLFMLSIRALIVEMHILKQDGKLSGQTSESRFNCFEKITETDQFSEYFENKYPLLIYKMRSLIKNTADYVCEIYQNFEKDKYLLKKNISPNIDKIKDIIIGEGDTHNNGKSVAVIYTDTIKLIYKPHSLSCDYSFEKLLDWINDKKIKYNLKGLKYISNKNYGWQEFIEYDGGLTNKQAKEYFYKCGSFLALFYVLGTTDIHFENVIVHKENPFFIDLETLVSIPKYIGYNSVLETDLIPGIYNNVVYDFDYSGLCGSGNVSSKIKTISIVNPRTDDMHIEYVESIIRENKNNVWVDGEKAGIEFYAQEVLDGFNEIWDLIFSRKKEFISLIDKVFGNKELYYRQVLRATQVYSKFLAAASHPDYLDSNEKQRILFQRLLHNVSDDKIIKRIQDEINQLCVGDVPYFMVKYDSPDLYSNKGIVCASYYKYTVKDSIIKRLLEPFPNSKIVQMDTIKKSLFTAYKTQFIESEESEKIDQKNFAEKTAKEITKKIINDSTGTIMFINSLKGKRFYLTGINLDIYEGGGIIWFLACYGILENNTEVYRISESLFDTTEQYFYNHGKNENPRLSAFSGIGSVIYLSYNLFLLTNKKKYYDCYKKYCSELVNRNQEIVNESKETDVYDFMCGISGLLIVLCKIYEKEKDQLLKDFIFKEKEKLLKWIKNNSFDQTGIAHGISGIIYALLILDKTFDELNYKEISLFLLGSEMDIYKAQKQFGVEWCHGISGLLFVRTVASMQWNEPSIREQINELFKLLERVDINTKNNCLCHGVRGIKESLSVVKEVHKNISSKIEQILALEEYNFWGLNHHTVENFMMGTSGVAYSYLKSKFNSLPSIMLLEIFNKY